MSSTIVNVLLLLIDFLNKSIYIKLKDIHFGFSTEEELRNLNKVSSTCAKAFKKEATIVIISIVKKLSRKLFELLFGQNCRCF